MKIFNLIKKLLEENPKLRDSDRLLQWEIWNLQGLIKNGSISKDNYVTYSKHFETIRRTRQKVQEMYHHLSSSSSVQAYKDEKQRSKGTFIYREQIEIDNYDYTRGVEMLHNALTPVINKIKSSQTSIWANR